jgi:hypothetical protein
MPTYHVYVPELHYQTYEVEADSPTEAARLVYQEGDGSEVGDPVFKRTLLAEDGFTNLLVEDPDTGEEAYIENVADLEAE